MDLKYKGHFSFLSGNFILKVFFLNICDVNRREKITKTCFCFELPLRICIFLHVTWIFYSLKRKKTTTLCDRIIFFSRPFLNKLNRLEKKQQREKVNNEEVFSKCVSNRIPIYTKKRNKRIERKEKKIKKNRNV